MIADPLLLRAPPWAVRTRDLGYASEWLAAPPLPSGERLPAVRLHIEATDGVLSVREYEPGTWLPVRCPELHVMGGSFFCLGLARFGADETGATAFWQALGEYLVNADHAMRRGHWPDGRWMSHGDAAAAAQVEAEAIAAKAGLADEYALWLEDERGWLSTFFPRDGKAPARLARPDPCPRGCRGEDGQARRIGDCQRRKALRRLVAAEAQRRRGQSGHYAALRACGVVCCGRMPRCELGARQAA